MRLFWVVGLSLSVAGCAGLPNTEKVSMLGDAMTATGKLAREAVAANRSNAVRLGEEEQVRALLKWRQGGSTVRNVDIEKALSNATDKEKVKADVKVAIDVARGQGSETSFTLADAPGAYLQGLQDGGFIDAIRALEEYGDELRKAVDGGAIEKLEQASAKLGDAAGSFLSTVVPGYGAIAAPAARIGGRIGGYLLTSSYASEIQAIVTDRNKDVQLLAKYVSDDMSDVAKLLKAQAGYFNSIRKQTLLIVARDPAVDQLQIYNEYFNARKEVNAMRALAAAAAKYQRVLKSLAEAHQAIATAEPNSELALRRFVALADDLAALIKAARKETDK